MCINTPKMTQSKLIQRIAYNRQTHKSTIDSIIIKLLMLLRIN